MLAKAVNDDTFVSLEGKTKHQLWLELCDIITRHPRDVTALKVDAILRSGIRKFTNEVCEGVLGRGHGFRASYSSAQDSAEDAWYLIQEASSNILLHLAYRGLQPRW